MSRDRYKLLADQSLPGSLDPATYWTRRNKRTRERYLSKLPTEVAAFMAAAAAGMGDRAGTGYVVANAEALLSAKIARAYDEEAIRAHADNYSRGALRIASPRRRESFAAGVGIVPTFGRGTTADGRAARLVDARWWRRQLRKSWTRQAEHGQREIGLIRRGRQPYASAVAVKHFGVRKRRAREWLEGCRAVNEEGEQLELLQVAERSLANPAIRRGELMVRARGFEELAAFHRHVPLFVTLTCPSRFHAQHSEHGANPLHNRESVREAQAWLCSMWAKARAKFQRLSILLYGFRVAEPHHDGTPHWHVLMFMRAADIDAVRAILSAIWLSDAGDERGARERRVVFQQIDPAKGSAVGYIAKYVAKNIDGQGAIGAAEDHETGAGVADGIVPVLAWAATHGIRQFQQIGGPAVGVYRELRRLREPVADADLERAREPADRGDWAGFVRGVGGIGAGRRINVKLAHERPAPFQVEARPRTNYYGEPCAPRLVGVRYAGTVAITRPHRWRIERRGSACVKSSGEGRGACHERAAGAPSPVFSDLGPVAITVRGAGSPDFWTNDNESSRAGPH